MNRERLDAAVRAAATVLRPHLGDDVALERARNMACVWACSDDDEPYTERDATEQILAARLDCYGGVPVTHDEAESLAARVLLALDGVA